MTTSAQKVMPPADVSASAAVDDFEVAQKYHLHPETEEWTGRTVRIKLAEQPFERGGARVCYKAKELLDNGVERCVVAKLFLEKTQDKQRYFNEAMTQMLSQEYAEEFNTYECISRKIRFNSIHVCKLVERDGQLATIEPYLDGNYFKHNDNDGYVCGTDPTPQAFSHFSWEASNQQLLICDIQGVGDTYTDPQIHTVTGNNFGVGNMGAEGIYKFFHTHRCNDICRALHLPPRGQSAVIDTAPTRSRRPSSELATKRSKEVPVINAEATSEPVKVRSSFGKSLMGVMKHIMPSSTSTSPISSSSRNRLLPASPSASDSPRARDVKAAQRSGAATPERDARRRSESAMATGPERHSLASPLGSESTRRRSSFEGKAFSATLGSADLRALSAEKTRSHAAPPGPGSRSARNLGTMSRSGSEEPDLPRGARASPGR